ncbi:MAG: chromosomal replication initiator protein DnaA [Bacilli bacterium]|nr:chromosomal replication initiator protein DnaA [Bacilli bacterium]MDD4733246.1 chromosomal replication initiator protein DnaA [Bacilli bacterium]
MEIKTIWNSFLEKIQKEVEPANFQSWFSESKLIDLNDERALILVPLTIHKKHLKDNYNNIVEEVFNEVTGSDFDIEYITEEEMDKNIEIPVTPGVPVELFETNLDEKYTFDNFIVGESNKFAKYNALAVAEKPGLVYNPLFIYSSSGLGKTHLMHSIGNYIVKNSNKRVLYIPCNDFIDDFIEMCRNNKKNNYDGIDEFRRKYREVDCLLIDDIQFIENVPTSQNEFFNIFNELFNNKKQIIIASDKSPDDLRKLEDRLRTRFNWGLTVDILPPNFDLRMELINNKLENHELKNTFPLEVKEYIASNCTSDIRKLEGAITRVCAYAAIMNNSNINLELAIEALKDFFTKSIISKNKIDRILDIVTAEYNISIEDIKGKKRTANITIPRQIAMYICREYLNESFAKIGGAFGGKDHTTVMHSVFKIENEIKINSDLKNQIDKIINKIK